MPDRQIEVREPAKGVWRVPDLLIPKELRLPYLVPKAGIDGVIIGTSGLVTREFMARNMSEAATLGMILLAGYLVASRVGFEVFQDVTENIINYGSKKN